MHVLSEDGGPIPLASGTRPDTTAFGAADAALGNHRVTTHWLFTDELKTRFPEMRLQADRICIVDGPIWTAGNSAKINLTLPILETG
jgi:transcriptional regulator GlxA family with amidase domain